MVAFEDLYQMNTFSSIILCLESQTTFKISASESHISLSSSFHLSMMHSQHYIKGHIVGSENGYVDGFLCLCSFLCETWTQAFYI